MNSGPREGALGGILAWGALSLAVAGLLLYVLLPVGAVPVLILGLFLEFADVDGSVKFVDKIENVILCAPALLGIGATICGALGLVPLHGKGLSEKRVVLMGLGLGIVLAVVATFWPRSMDAMLSR